MSNSGGGLDYQAEDWILRVLLFSSALDFFKVYRHCYQTIANKARQSYS